ncbi:PREDICTED: uncharacterized protein LOC108978967 [Bactrocera latifrons]|uniref:Uncharacterized protein n=1 Tax=Bactrocera latifrons TaxID=174628 RepID=A0A0K8W3W5_BACLA|nr:PREDICTED: uncharacterized protein LOC108978967 [Bactrocera latifrons]
MCTMCCINARPEIYFQTVHNKLSINLSKMFKITDSPLTFLGIFSLALAVFGVQSKTISAVRPFADLVENSEVNDAPTRARRSYFWVEDGSDKVTIVENKHLRRTLEEYRRNVHGEEKQRDERYRSQYEERRQEYGEDEEVQEHTPLFVPNLFG